MKVKQEMSAPRWLWMMAILVCLIGIPVAEAMAEGDARDDYFVDVQWLQENLNNVTVVDARSARDYGRGHLPGAVSAPWQSFADMTGKPGEPGWGALLPPEVLAGKFEEKGFSPKKPIVVYCKTPGWGEDGRIAWMLIMAGYTDVRMLDGGFAAWKRAGGQITKSDVEIPPVKVEIERLAKEYTASTDWITANMKNIVIVDSRTRSEFRGAKKYGEARGGHLPGAVLVPFEDMFDTKKKIRSIQELRALFTQAGLKPEDRIVTYCTGGIRSAHMALMLRMTGFSHARNYDTSFYEWAGNPQLRME